MQVLVEVRRGWAIAPEWKSAPGRGFFEVNHAGFIQRTGQTLQCLDCTGRCIESTEKYSPVLRKKFAIVDQVIPIARSRRIRQLFVSSTLDFVMIRVERCE